MKRVLFAMIAVLALWPAVAASSAGSEDLLGLRGARHKGFHRFVIALSSEAIYRVRARGKMVEIILPDVDARGVGPVPVKSGFFSVKSVRTRRGNAGQVTTITLSMRAGARIRERVLRNPYRIVVDMYPSSPWRPAAIKKPGHPKKRLVAKKKKSRKTARRNKPRKLKKSVKNEKTMLAASSRERPGVRPVHGDKPGVHKESAGHVKKAHGRGHAVSVQTKKGGPLRKGSPAPKKKEKKPGPVELAGAVKQGGVKGDGKGNTLKEGSKVRLARMKRARVLMNSGWRREYRQKALHRLKGALRADRYRPGPGPGLLGLFIPLKGAEARQSGLGADAYVKILEEEGETDRAATLGAMLELLTGEAGPEVLEGVILRREENDLTPLARFVLASSFEAEGLYTEAGAYYGMVYESDTRKELRAAAALGKARALLLTDRMAESTRWFSRAMELGEKEAPAWLAGVYVLRGKYEEAARLFSGLGRMKNPVALMGLGDFEMRRGEYEGAVRAFKELSMRFRDDDFLRSFFSMRLGDAMLGLGKEKEAMDAYKSIRKDSKGEGREMAAMALADYYSGIGKKPLLAIVLYKEVAGSLSPVAGDARIRLAALLERRRRHRVAMETLNAFFVGNIPPKSSELIRFWRSKIAFNWISDLHEKKNWLAVLEVNYRYGDLVTLVKRAEASLMVGEAMLHTGLTPDAVLALKRAVNLGTRDVKTKALFLLVSHYLGQRDHGAARRLLEDIRSISPRLVSTPLWKGYDIRARFLAGSYDDVIRLGSTMTDGQTQLMVGRAYGGLGRWKDAGRAFRRAAARYRKEKDKKGLLASLTGYGDSLFGMGDYAGAAKAYGSALESAGDVSPAEANWVRYRLSLSYARAGKTARAVEVINELRKRDRDFSAWAEALSLKGAGG